jgi:hypothetical protein
MRMRRHSFTLPLGFITLPLGFGLMLLGGCAYHTYAPGPGMSALDLGPDSEHCHQSAQSTRPDTSFQASGSPRSIAVAAAIGLIGGAITTAIHDSQAYDNCMLSNGYLIADGATGGPTLVQPVVATDAVPSQAIQVQTFEPPQRQSTFGNARAEQAAHARSTAEAWLVAQHILNGPDASQEKRGLYGALCDAGDRSACFMAVALSRTYEIGANTLESPVTFGGQRARFMPAAAVPPPRHALPATHALASPASRYGSPQAQPMHRQSR